MLGGDVFGTGALSCAFVLVLLVSGPALSGGTASSTVRLADVGVSHRRFMCRHTYSHSEAFAGGAGNPHSKT